MKNHRISILGLIAFALLGGMAVAQNSVTPVPDCGIPQIQSDTVMIVNPCGITVNVTFTSSGEIWGGTLIGPGQSASTGQSTEALSSGGGLHVYTCPGYGTPVQPDGSAIVNGNYTGLRYGCHGSAQDESGENSAPQLMPTPQPQVEQSDNVQQADGDDDDDEAQDADADSDGAGADQASALQQVYELMRQNLNAAAQEAAHKSAPQSGGSRGTNQGCQGPVGGGWCR